MDGADKLYSETQAQNNVASWRDATLLHPKFGHQPRSISQTAPSKLLRPAPAMGSSVPEPFFHCGEGTRGNWLDSSLREDRHCFVLVCFFVFCFGLFKKENTKSDTEA